jgi:formylmethanofuran dehydrogenase subunit E
MSDFKLDPFLSSLELLHDHICPRQILGLRMGIYGAQLLKLNTPRSDKRMVVFVETDGCFADGVSVATGCTLGHRTMRLMDFGKVAITLVDVQTSQAVRIAPRPGVRELARKVAPDARSRWHAQLEGYQRVPDEELLAARSVCLNLSLEKLISVPGHRVTCEVCGEEIINEREVTHEGTLMCRACAGEAYYQGVDVFLQLPGVC